MQPKRGIWRKGNKGWRGGATGLRLLFLRKDLNKWVDFDPFKYTVD